jgi:hypothetical protein
MERQRRSKQVQNYKKIQDMIHKFSTPINIRLKNAHPSRNNFAASSAISILAACC